MTIVAGVDFGTLSVRVTLVDSTKGPIGTASGSYPLNRRRDDPNFATQSHADQMAALAAATRDVLKNTGIDGSAVAAIALDTTGLYPSSSPASPISASESRMSPARPSA